MNHLFICLLIVMTLLFFLYLFYYRRYEYYQDPIVSFYHEQFQREPDPLSLFYYRMFDEPHALSQLDTYRVQVEKGKQYSSEQGVVIAGLIRNQAHNIPYLKQFYERIKSSFKETLFLIVENDSEDSTRYELLQWSTLDPTVMLLCHDSSINSLSCSIQGFEQPIVENHPYATRICKLSYLRNIYIQYIYQHIDPQRYPYLFIKDLDLHGTFCFDGLFHSMYQFQQNPSINAIGCNGLVSDKQTSSGLRYYDSFAYISLHESDTWNTDFDKHSHDQEVLQYLCDKYKRNMELDRVKSAFGGFCCYRMSDLFKSQTQYQCTQNEQLGCEHSFFHRSLSNIYVNPRMVYLIY